MLGLISFIFFKKNKFSQIGQNCYILLGTIHFLSVSKTCYITAVDEEEQTATVEAVVSRVRQDK